VSMRRAIPLVAVALVAAGVVAAIALAHRPHRAAQTVQAQRMRTPAPVFLATVVKLLFANRYGSAWASLNPAHQAVAPRAEYVACERQSPIRLHLVSLEVLAVRRERVRIVSRGRRTDSVAVAFDALVSQKGSKFPVLLHLHAVSAGSHWTWILPRSRYALYRSNGCAGNQDSP
jgi:hypothetical protein